MSKNYRLIVDVASALEDFADLRINIWFGEGAPNLEVREEKGRWASRPWVGL